MEQHTLLCVFPDQNGRHIRCLGFSNSTRQPGSQCEGMKLTYLPSCMIIYCCTIFLKVCDESLTCIRPHVQGQLAAVANKKGATYLIEFSEALTVNQKNDKLLLTAVSISVN